MKLSEAQTDGLVQDITNAGAQYVCGQRPIRRHLDAETKDIIHQGHANLTDGIESLYRGEAIEIGLESVRQGVECLERGYEAAEKDVLASSTILDSDTTGLARMKDALNQLKQIVADFQPLMEDVQNC